MNTQDRRKWNNILIFVCCAFIIALIATSYKKGEKNVNEIYPPKTATKIVFNSPRSAYTFQYKNDAWLLSKPFKYSAINEHVEKILAIQDSPIYKHIKNTNSDEFGFDEQHYLKINRLKIFFGDKAINSEHRYIRIDERIFLIDDRIYALLSAGLAYWLNKEILTSSELLTSISIDKDLYKEADLINLADAWYDTKAKSLLHPADSFITPANNDVPITVTFANDQTLQFLMHKQRFLVNTTFNLAYELDAETAKKLLTP